MTIKNTALTRRGLRHIINAADARITELETDNQYKSQGLTKSDVDEIKVARDWLKQESQEPQKKEPKPPGNAMAERAARFGKRAKAA